MKKKLFPLTELFRGFPPITARDALEMAAFHAKKSGWTKSQRAALAVVFLELQKEVK